MIQVTSKSTIAIAVFVCVDVMASNEECKLVDGSEICEASNVSQEAVVPPPLSSDDRLLSHLIFAAFLLGIAITSVPYWIRILDGRPFAHLVVWGIIPEAWVSGSVPALCALLELKESLRPEIALTTGAVDDSNIGALGEAIQAHGKMAQIRTIALINHNNLSVDGVGTFCQKALQLSSPVEELDLTGNIHFGNTIVDILTPYIAERSTEHRQLRELRLIKCSITAEGACSLGKALTTSILRTLDLSLNSLAGAGQALGELIDAPLLEELILVRCGLSDDDFVFVADELSGTRLRSLEVSGNAMTEAGLAAFVEPLAEAHLANLSLASNQISAGNALARLATAWSAKPDRRGILRLRGNKVSLAESQAFEELMLSLGMTNYKWDS